MGKRPLWGHNACKRPWAFIVGFTVVVTYTEAFKVVYYFNAIQHSH